MRADEIIRDELSRLMSELDCKCETCKHAVEVTINNKHWRARRILVCVADHDEDGSGWGELVTGPADDCKRWEIFDE